jgi:hypothetical protein
MGGVRSSRNATVWGSRNATRAHGRERDEGGGAKQLPFPCVPFPACALLWVIFGRLAALAGVLCDVSRVITLFSGGAFGGDACAVGGAFGFELLGIAGEV